MLEDLFAQLGVGDYAYTEELVPLTYSQFDNWVEANYQGNLTYLSDERKLIRSDLRNFFSDAQSALVFLFPYLKKKESDRLAAFISGFDDRDYHFVIEEKLTRIVGELQKRYSNLTYKISIDKHPVLERDLAYRAGLGWFGKSSMLIHPKLGTFHMIGALILSQKLDFPTRKKEGEFCGACKRCLDSCPTKAIVAPKIVDAQKCISAFTLEQFKASAPPVGHETQTYRAGCDLCQVVCPWNKKHLKEGIELSPLELLFKQNDKELREEIATLSKKQYEKKFEGTSLKRLGKNGLLKNFFKE